MRERYYRPELDALRFFAFATVFMRHAPWRSHAPTISNQIGITASRPSIPHQSSLAVIDTTEALSRSQTFVQSLRLGAIHEACAFGLCIFFLLSSYLIVTILLRERDSTGTVSLSSFAARRVLRIWPLYFFILASAYVLGRFHPEVSIHSKALLAFSFLLGNLYILKHGWVLDTINPLWSLSIEEQFYLVIPGLTRAGGRRALTIICWLTLAFSYILLIWLGHRHSISLVGVWANSFVQFQFFAAGGLIALAHSRGRLSLSTWARLGLVVAGCIMWYIASARFGLQTFRPSTPAQLVAGYLFLLSGTVAIFLAVLDADIKIPKIIIYLGKISYGLYLFHQLFLWTIFDSESSRPSLVFLRNHIAVGVLLALTATIAAASLSYHFFERPILLFKARFETVKTRVA
jgi:peptidoglycan/LPS O-acetylase OafA/YrhL